MVPLEDPPAYYHFKYQSWLTTYGCVEGFHCWALKSRQSDDNSRDPLFDLTLIALVTSQALTGRALRYVMGCQFVCDHITAYCIVCTIRDLLKNRWTRQRVGGGGGVMWEVQRQCPWACLAPAVNKLLLNICCSGDVVRWGACVLQLTSVYWRSRISVVIASAVLLYSRIPIFKTLHFSVIAFFLSAPLSFHRFPVFANSVHYNLSVKLQICVRKKQILAARAK